MTIEKNSLISFDSLELKSSMTILVDDNTSFNTLMLFNHLGLLLAVSFSTLYDCRRVRLSYNHRTNTLDITFVNQDEAWCHYGSYNLTDDLVMLISTIAGRIK